MQDKPFFEKINSINSKILSQNEATITKDLLFGSEKLESDKNKSLLLSTQKDLNSHYSKLKLAGISGS